MKRSKWKGPFVGKKTQEKQTVVSRNAEITLDLKNKILWIHNGRSLIKVIVVEDMVGHKAGEFVSTRGKFSFKKKKKKK